MVSLFSKFPELPFLDIDPALRKQGCETLDRLRRSLAIRICDPQVEVGAQDNVVQIVVARCASSSDAEAFVHRIPRPTHRGQTSPGDRLKMLAAWRLYQHFGARKWAPVVEYARGMQSTGPWHPDYPREPEKVSGWSTAKGKAQENIDGVLMGFW